MPRRPAEHSFANLSLMRPEDLDGIRRSLAIGGTLTRVDSERLIEACAKLLDERAAIVRILAELGSSWTGARRALNELARIVNGGG